VPVAMVILVIG